MGRRRRRENEKLHVSSTSKSGMSKQRGDNDKVETSKEIGWGGRGWTVTPKQVGKGEQRNGSKTVKGCVFRQFR